MIKTKIYIKLKLSNEIIRRCCACIDLEKIFNGYVLSSKKALNECIECCNSWKDIYANVWVFNCSIHLISNSISLYIQAVKVHEKFHKKGWQLDKTTIFAQIDAFIQRCKDLIDVWNCIWNNY